jgi:3-oxoacyl-[acyl-carrier-protein] synthase-3
VSAALAIQAADWFVPETTTAVAELPSVDRGECLRLGIDEVRSSSLGPHELAVRAARRLLAGGGLTGADLGALILVEPRVPETFLASGVTRLQAELDATRAVVFTVGGLGCVSITPALLAGRGLLAADPDLDNVLVLHGSTPATPGRYRHPVTVNGDGGLAVLLGRRGPVRVLDILQQTDGAYWDLFEVDYRGRPPAEWREECRDLPAYSFRLTVETGRRLAALHRLLLERNGLRVDDIACYIGPNLSAGALEFAAEALGVKIALGCADNLRQYGHLGPIDVLLNLYTELRAGRLAAGDHAVLLNTSPVAAWSLLLVRVGDGDALYL